MSKLWKISVKKIIFRKVTDFLHATSIKMNSLPCIFQWYCLHFQNILFFAEQFSIWLLTHLIPFCLYSNQTMIKAKLIIITHTYTQTHIHTHTHTHTHTRARAKTKNTGHNDRSENGQKWKFGRGGGGMKVLGGNRQIPSTLWKIRDYIDFICHENPGYSSYASLKSNLCRQYYREN